MPVRWWHVRFKLDWPWPIALAGVFGLALCLSSTWHSVELWTFDQLTVRTAPNRADLPITILSIDEESMGAIGQQWPWPRSIHAKVLDNLKEAGVAVAAFDVVFAEPDPRPGEDAAFARAIRNFGRVVLAANLEYRETKHARQWVRSDPRPEFIEAGAVAGLATVKTDPDGVLRKVPLSQGAFWLEVISSFDKVQPGVARNLSVTQNDRIRYLGPPQTFTTIPYHRLLDPANQLSENWKDVLRDNIVLVGRGLKTMPDLTAVEADMFFTPFQASTGLMMPGVEVHATLVANMMTGEPLRETPALFSMVLVLAATGLAWLTMRSWHPWRSGAWAAVLGVVIAGADAALFQLQHQWLPAAAALATIAMAWTGQGALAFIGEQARRLELRRAFAHYVSPAIVDAIIADPGALKLGGVRQEVTLLFTDLAGFTGISEGMQAEEVAKVLNRHLAEMTEIVIANGGTVDKFIGDAIMAFWGAPVADPEQSSHAVAAAIAMQARMAATRAELVAAGGPALRMRIGLHRGESIVGNLGGALRFQYTAIGDTVNLASRLEGVNNVYGTGILMSDAVASTCGIAGLRPVDTVRVKGRQQPVALFTPCDDPALVERTVPALEAWRRGDWQQAKALWQALANDYPDDPVAKVFVTRLESWESLGWDWDGVWKLESK